MSIKKSEQTKKRKSEQSRVRLPTDPNRYCIDIKAILDLTRKKLDDLQLQSEGKISEVGSVIDRLRDEMDQQENNQF